MACRNRGHNAEVSVVDAAHLVDSPFYLVSVFHHISTVDAVPRELAIRAVASRPTRIEAYQSDGSLIFVDANGNGSFADSGDLVASDLIYELNPVLSLGGEDMQIELMYQPIDGAASERIEIEIQANDLSTDETWEVHAVDWLEVSRAVR